LNGHTILFIETPYLSPLGAKEYQLFEQLHTQLQESFPLDILLGNQFYSQFQGNHNFDEKMPSGIGEQLQNGKYVWIARRGPEEKMRIHHGHIKNFNDEVLALTHPHFADNTVRLPLSQIIAIYGKGFESIYQRPKIES
jgi:hypothetical protein